MRLLTILATTAAIALAGCQTTDPYTGEQKTSHATRGAVLGGLIGAAAGALTNTGSGKQATKNALIGAGIGALAGGAVGNYMDRQEATLRDRLRGSGVSVTRVGNDIVLNMQNDILFALDSTELSYRAVDTIRSVAIVLEEFNQSSVEVNGHTDTTGSHDYNQRLSYARAGAVADVLADNGVVPARIIVQGFGETRLKVPTPDGVNEPRNRRVEIRIVPHMA